MLTPDQILASAPDAASLKAGRGLATSRKWVSAGGDQEVLWGLAMGSGKEPYQTRVALTDLASKCSCPSRKFPCKHALGLMLLAVGEPAALTETGSQRPPWVTEWLEARTAREQKAVARAEEKAANPKAVDEKAAEKRRVQRRQRVDEGVALLQQAIHDLTREGLAAPTARDPAHWENLARRMVDSQAPGLAGVLRQVADTVLSDPDVDRELPLELGRLALLLEAWQGLGETDPDPALSAELQAQLGLRAAGEEREGEAVTDEWFLAARRVEERDRLITSSSWLWGAASGRWARVLRFAPVPQTIAEPWPLGATVRATLTFSAGLYPQRAQPGGEERVLGFAPPPVSTATLAELLEKFAAALAENPFLRVMPFLIPLCPAADGSGLVDDAGCMLPWRVDEALALRLECICGGRTVPLCGEWDGRLLRPLAALDGESWIPLVPQQP